MKRKKRKRTNEDAVIFLALFHRYICPLLPFWLPIPLRTIFPFWLSLGILWLFYALYTWIGYQRRWKHLYCSYQNAYHREMTPEHIRWNDIKKSDVYSVTILFGLFGLLALAVFLID